MLAAKMGDNTADSIINAVAKFAWPIFGILVLTSGAVLFWPSGAVLFQLNHLPKWILDYAGLAFLISAAALICLVVAKLYRLVFFFIRASNHKRDIKNNLDSLSWEEQAILREYFLSGSDVINLPYQHPSVISLRNKRILFLAAKTAIGYGIDIEFAHQLPPGIREMIKPEMIELTKAERLHESNLQEFEAFRPSFRHPRRGYY